MKKSLGYYTGMVMLGGACVLGTPDYSKALGPEFYLLYHQLLLDDGPKGVQQADGERSSEEYPISGPEFGLGLGLFFGTPLLVGVGLGVARAIREANEEIERRDFNREIGEERERWKSLR